MAAAVQTRAAGKQAVAVADVANVILCAARCNDGARAAVLPQINVVLRIERDDTPARGAGGGLDADAVGKRSCKKSVRIGFAQVVFCEERQLVQILQTSDIRGRQSFLLHFFAVVGDIVPDVFHLLQQALVLPCADLLAAGAFDLGLIVSLHSWSPYVGFLFSGVLAKTEGFFVEFEELFRYALFNRGHPFVLGEVEIAGKTAQQNKVDGLSRA